MVVPAKAGTHTVIYRQGRMADCLRSNEGLWVPAFAGTTG